MAKTKWRCREYIPSANQSGEHCYYAEAVISGDITNVDLAQRIQSRTGVEEEMFESHRVTLTDTTGTKMVSFYPRVSGSVSDSDILRETTAAHAADPSKPIRSVARESDLTNERLTWTLGATMGVKFSRRFAIQNESQKVRAAPVGHAE